MVVFVCFFVDHLSWGKVNTSMAVRKASGIEYEGIGSGNKLHNKIR